MKILDKFVENLEDEESVVDIESLIKGKDLRFWEKWVSLFEDMIPSKIPSFLKFASANIKLTHEDEIILLAYIKHIELQMERAKEFMESQPKEVDDYNGPSYG
jgi:hypothetical protein|tara:strand:- start:123 stop:431 length:309 start_codon:yes stop_codon:yes gene_type:complete